MRETRACYTVVLAIFLLSLAATTSIAPASASVMPAGGKASTKQSYPNASWALGVVVPDGARLQGGGKLSWGQVSNVTADVTLPNITLPDSAVYAILSVMTSDGSVLQVAAGLHTNSTGWLLYAWFIGNARSIPPEYTWVLNGSKPSMPSGSRVSLSILRLGGNWALEATDLGTSSSVIAKFPTAASASIATGDQEVFALESYSRLASTFSEMGNLTLDELLTDGLKVDAGFYTYGAWDPTHTLLFVVGGAGSNPPAFVSIDQPNPGTFAWGFIAGWNSIGPADSKSLETVVTAVLWASAGVFILVAVVSVRRRMLRSSASEGR